MQFPVEEIYVETALPFGLRTVLSFDPKAHFRQRLQRLIHSFISPQNMIAKKN